MFINYYLSTYFLFEKMILVSIFIIFIYLKKYVDIFFAFYGDYKNLKKNVLGKKIIWK